MNNSLFVGVIHISKVYATGVHMRLRMYICEHMYIYIYILCECLCACVYSIYIC